VNSVSTSLIWSEAQADARALGSHSDPRRLLGAALGLADALLIAAAAVLAYVLRHGFTTMPLDVAASAVLAVVLTLNAFYLSGGYSALVTDTLVQQCLRVMQVWTAVFGALLLLGYLTKTSDLYSRAWAVIWYGGTLACLLGARCIAAIQVMRWHARGRLAGTLAIVDLCNSGDQIGMRIRRKYPDQAHLVGVFRAGDASAGTDGIDDLLALSRLFRIDDVMVVTSAITNVDLPAILRRLGTMQANVSLCPLMPTLASTPIHGASVRFDLPSLIIHRKPLSGLNSLMKRAEDLVIGTLMLVAMAPVMLLIAACIRAETPGPVLFRQARQGFNNNVFTVFKFRSMVHRPEGDTEVRQATRDDKRVTRVGRVLRRTSLDELPQLFNVLRGEMSLVGPRPHAVEHNLYYASLIDDYINRHKVQPGITGWAQVNGHRGATDTPEQLRQRVEHDLYYIDNWSFWLDLRILLLTPLKILIGENAF
jgi:putative colanic acid biosynthesis UDP-glucose lipid carrier transferase